MASPQITSTFVPAMRSANAAARSGSNSNAVRSRCQGPQDVGGQPGPRSDLDDVVTEGHTAQRLGEDRLLDDLAPLRAGTELEMSLVHGRTPVRRRSGRDRHRRPGLLGRHALVGRHRIGHRVGDIELDQLGRPGIRLLTRGSLLPRVAGSVGTDVSGDPTCSVEVRSPVTLRRQAVMLGAFTPNRVSRNRNCDVWSKVSEHTYPPRLNGDTTRSGTRNPRPRGPAIAVGRSRQGVDGQVLPRRAGRGHRGRRRGRRTRRSRRT